MEKRREIAYEAFKVKRAVLLTCAPSRIFLLPPLRKLPRFERATNSRSIAHTDRYDSLHLRLVGMNGMNDNFLFFFCNFLNAYSRVVR